MTSKKYTKACPKCESDDIIYIPWLGQLWECKKCGYRGAAFVEMTQRAMLEMLLKIPRGRVTTYNSLAKKLNIHPRRLAKMLSENESPDKYPCYKVVNSDGSLGGYILGITEKKKRLKNDGIEIKKNKIDLKKHLFEF